MGNPKQQEGTEANKTRKKNQQVKRGNEKEKPKHTAEIETREKAGIHYKKKVQDESSTTFP